MGSTPVSTAKPAALPRKTHRSMERFEQKRARALEIHARACPASRGREGSLRACEKPATLVELRER